KRESHHKSRQRLLQHLSKRRHHDARPSPRATPAAASSAATPSCPLRGACSRHNIGGYRCGSQRGASYLVCISTIPAPSTTVVPCWLNIVVNDVARRRHLRFAAPLTVRFATRLRPLVCDMIILSTRVHSRKFREAVMDYESRRIPLGIEVGLRSAVTTPAMGW